MKKVFVVSKTHLDLGFTDYAENIRRKYINEFIPGAIELANKVNKNEKKNFVWTTGSWILKEALENGTKEQKANLRNAIKNGDIAPHAMPFTTHTELLDCDTLDYGLSIVDELDKIRGRKTISAKMTDVPGHTKGLVKMLAKHGIKLLHIGVNGASSVPDVPSCFVWKCGESEIVVIYSGDYGGAFKCDYIDEVLYFDHTLDNHGAPSAEKVQTKLNRIQAKFSGYEIEAGTIDDYAELIWEIRDKLPVLENEIGDTWIHGSASDPYKSSALRQLMVLKQEWIANGTMQKNSKEYIGFSDNLLCISEHTCGVDTKVFFADYEHYLKKDFQEARKKDKSIIRHPLRDFPYNFLVITNRLVGKHRKCSYKATEKSWAEQRAYIHKAVSFLNEEHRRQAESALELLIPEKPADFEKSENCFEVIKCGEWSFKLNSKGGIGMLKHNMDDVIRPNDLPVVEYHSYSNKNYDFWLKNYSRNLKHTKVWCYGDFARPLLKYAEGKYPVGRFAYHLDSAGIEKAANGSYKVYSNLKCDSMLCNELGAPRLIQIIYILTECGLKINLSWFEKDASRLTEALFMRLYPADGEFRFNKLGESINPNTTVYNGSRNLHAVMSTEFTLQDKKYSIFNYSSPLVSIGKGKILEFDNEFESAEQDGIAYVLYNNVWGTNFPLWYEDNAYFEFNIQQANQKNINDI